MNAVAAQRLRDVAFVIAVAADVAERNVRVAAAQRTPVAVHAATTGTTAQIMDCIKAHESGNYTEHSHPGSGSGAYQYVPGTWRTWSARAGYGGYAYAYLAPPDVQDAVTVFTLTNGGAGNWSTRWGPDPCTGN